MLSLILAAAIQSEAHYVDEYCIGARVRNSDRTETDCLTENYAIEYDFSHKWYEALGQSLHYSVQTNKPPAIVLIKKKPTEPNYEKRLGTVIENFCLPVTVWTLNGWQKDAELELISTGCEIKKEK